MNSDLLPSTAFALESWGPGATLREGQTLTMRLALAHSASGSMSGSASTKKSSSRATGLLRASVVPADASGLTITF